MSSILWNNEDASHVIAAKSLNLKKYRYMQCPGHIVHPLIIIWL